MNKRHLVVIDITGRQSEDKSLILRVIRSLHNIVYGYNSMHNVSVTDDEYEKLLDGEFEYE